MPQTSILIPTHNRADVIGETLESVLAQTETDWECVVVDDGSADHTEAVIAEWHARDPRFRYVRHESVPGSRDAKVVAVRQFCLAQSRCPLVAFLDDDDVWLPTYLEQTTRVLRERPDLVVAASPRLFWDGETITETQEFLPGQLAYPLRGLIRHCFLVPSQCVIRREALDRTPGFRALGSEDYDLWLQLLPARPPSGGVGYVLEPLVKYRVHAGSSLLDPTGEKRRRLAVRHMEVLRLFLQRRDITLYDRLLAWGNIQRKHEQLLEFDIEEGKVPPSRLTRLMTLLSIVPTPLLRNPSLARQYLAYKSPS